MSRRVPRLVAAFSAGLILCTFVPNKAAGKDDDFVTGSGSSYAQIIRVGPTAGQLSLAPVVGLALADYVNTVGRGQATVADWAGIGVAQRALPDNTPILKVNSTQKDSDKGKTTTTGGQSDGQTGGGVAELYARATKAPFGEGRFRLASLEVPGVVEARSSESYASAGVKGNLRTSTAISKIGLLDIAGLVQLKGLRWESVQTTGSKKSMTSKFTIEGVSVGGMPLPLAGGTADLKTITGPINDLLAPIGFSISLPLSENKGGQAGVAPLSIDIKNSPAGRQYIAPLLEQLRPAREPVADAFIDLAKQLVALNEEIPDASVGILLADISLGILSGSSQLHLEFGGTTAFTEGQRFDSPFGKGIDFNPPKVGPVQTVAIPGSPGTPGTTAVVPSDEGTLIAAPVTPASKTIPGDKGGVAVMVGLIGLGVAIGLALADWYRMRMSRRAMAEA